MNPSLIGISASAAVAAAAGGISYAAVYPRSQLFGETIRRTMSPQQLALTFDDGPNPAITPLLLNLLDKHKVSATFFVIGQFVRKCPDVTKEIFARGHVLGNHTQTHPNLFWYRPSAIRSELRQCQNALEDTVGSAAKYFRPPFGLRNPWVVSTASELGMETVMWTLLPGDWREKQAEWLIRRMQPIALHAKKMSHRNSGDILCLHDGAHRGLNGDRTRTLAALEYWLPRWSDLGLKFVTIGEAARTPAS
ncbi:MAG TPA: polysaccharide deacetylase family protein [Candidatus Acidoferrum sp.]|jgi:peptidoglycan/xylan/chitin deacetylase (PgdA/CDA1 family)